jgi:hypothetical protein
VKLKPPVLEQMRDVYKYMYEKMITDKKLLEGESYEEYASDVYAFGPDARRLRGLHDGTTR